jgi:hypothetical protein
MFQIPVSPAADGSDDAQPRCTRFVTALTRGATAFPGGSLPSILRRRRLRRPAWNVPTRGGWTAAHHAIYSKEQSHGTPSPPATAPLSLDPASWQYRSEQT